MVWLPAVVMFKVLSNVLQALALAGVNVFNSEPSRKTPRLSSVVLELRSAA